MNDLQVPEIERPDEMATEDGYESGNDLPEIESSFSSLDDDGPIEIFATYYDEDCMGTDEADDIIVSSEGPHFCVECHPWDDDRARDYMRQLYQHRNHISKQKQQMDSEIAEIQSTMHSTPYHLRYKLFSKLRILQVRQFGLRQVYRKLMVKLHHEARLYLLRMNGK